jgi:hypothetical protein
MAPTYRDKLDRDELEVIAWGFLRSEFASQRYSQWTLDRRIDAYLLHNGPARLVNDGSAYDALLERIMANMAAAVRAGVQRSPEG